MRAEPVSVRVDKGGRVAIAHNKVIQCLHHVCSGLVLLVAFACTLGGNAHATGWQSTVAVLEDRECGLSAEQIAAGHTGRCHWEPVGESMLNFGFSSSTYWIRFNVKGAEAAGDHLLEVANPKISQIDAYLLAPSAGGLVVQTRWASGIATPVSDRHFSHRHYVFPMTLSDGQSHAILLRVQSQYPLKLPLFWSNTAEFHERNVLQTLFQGIYFGTILIMAFYNLFIYLMVRDRSYALYFVFMLVMGFFLAVDRGFAYQFLWPGQVHADYVAYVALMSFAAAWSVFFSIEFLSLREHLPKFAKGFTWLGIFWLLMTLIALRFASPGLVIFEVLVVVTAGGALLAAGVIAWRKGVPAAPYYLIAWVVIIHGAVVYALTLVDLFPSGWYAEYALQVSSIIEAALLSLGLAHRIKTLDRERSIAYAAARAKTDFIATISHEIRTPMNGMLGMAQLLRETGVNDQQQRYVNTILSSGQALLTLLNDTLDFSKIEAKKLELECLEFDLRQVIDDSAAIFSLRAEEKGLRFFVDVDVRVPRRVMGDPTRVRQVLANLLSNAFKFTDKGGVTLAVIVDGEERQLAFSVQDTGLGMSSETLVRLFSPYVQANASTARKFGGTGLGLSICKHLVEMMGGAIEVTSAEGVGSRFRFTLPLEWEDCADTAVVRPATASFKAVQLVSMDAALERMVAAYAHQLQLPFRSYPHLSALADAMPEPGSMVLVDSRSVAQALAALPGFGDYGGGWLQCQWGVIVKPGVQVNTPSGYAHPVWVYETPFSVSLFQQHLSGVSLAGKKSPSSAQAAVTPTVSCRGRRVLVVDDNPINSLVVCGFLNKLEIESKVAHNALEALEMLSVGPNAFDLVFMDCEMPGMNGYEATAEIRRREQQLGWSRLTIVALSAHVQSDHRQKCLSAGMDDVLTKPILFADLQTKVTTLLNR